jgi:hypothetical protein
MDLKHSVGTFCIRLKRYTNPAQKQELLTSFTAGAPLDELLNISLALHTCEKSTTIAVLAALHSTGI